MLARLTFSLMGGKGKEAKAENAERLKCNRDHRFALQGPFSHNQPTRRLRLERKDRKYRLQRRQLLPVIGSDRGWVFWKIFSAQIGNRGGVCGGGDWGAGELS